MVQYAYTNNSCTRQLQEGVQRAVEVFESEDTAHKWLKTSLPVLGNQTPLQAVSNRFGAELVLDFLGRIEHGVYS